MSNDPTPEQIAAACVAGLPADPGWKYSSKVLSQTCLPNTAERGHFP